MQQETKNCVPLVRSSKDQTPKTESKDLEKKDKATDKTLKQKNQNGKWKTMQILYTRSFYGEFSYRESLYSGCWR